MVSSGALPDPSFLFAQALSGLTAAMFLFLIAAGLSLIFGVLRVLNFAHGTFYMLGAYSAYQLVQWLGTGPITFWIAALGAATGVALLGGIVERFLFQRLYGKEELYQLLFTYALVLILSDVAKIIWGTQQKSVSRPAGLTGAVSVFGATIPDYNLFIILLGPAIALGFWYVLQRTRVGRFIRAAALDRETLGALGVNVKALYTGVFMLASFLGGLGGALISPMRAIVPGMDTEVIVEAFVVVVIGGLGSFWGTFLGALIYGQVLSFGILFFPRFSIFSIFALVFGFFSVRLTRIYFAMLTLAFAQIVWAICFKWNEVTGGEQGMPEIPYPDFAWLERVATAAPFLSYRTSEYFYFLTLLMVALCLWLLRRIVGSPFGRMLTTIRENPERAEFIGVNVRRYELGAFVIAGAFAGLAGGLFGIFNRGVFPDFAYWTKSSEVLIMTLLGGMGTFFGPALGALVLLWLNQQIVSYTEYWPLILGVILVILLFVFPGGLAGAALGLWRRLSRRPASA